MATESDVRRVQAFLRTEGYDNASVLSRHIRGNIDAGHYDWLLYTPQERMTRRVTREQLLPGKRELPTNRDVRYWREGLLIGLAVGFACAFAAWFIVRAV